MATGAAAAAEGGGPIIRITGLNKWFDDFQVLKNISLTVNLGERVVV